jgi:hypothetical protein
MSRTVQNNGIAQRAKAFSRRAVSPEITCSAVVAPCERHPGMAVLLAMRCEPGSGCTRCEMPVCPCLSSAPAAPGPDVLDEGGEG